ncbi:MAG: SDR family NAD(P)-dependent oxidoreductase [Alphaproteobacteria bacterium]|nr:SDR family NAD(P)-dependent oxidoreductase [Alphaproteobacteria bacterium]MDE2112890.1 SDR family NAD(P)-dependent oxidoreductase [Alphaproteobacteria bacterium]MDE2495298.1 SDR family NAD(P)-dependent oxidoreductase [Alphaproteobacteria bacterium]
MKSIVVTGASTGIGWGVVEILIEKGFRVFGSVRKEADAERLRKEFGANFVPLLFDVTDAQAVAKAAGQVGAALAGETLFGLVNNAGIAVPGPLLYLKVEEFRRQLEVNVTGQLIVTQAFAPLLMAKGPGLPGEALGAKPGRIVMITSVGGRNATPFVGPYCASKFALEGMSESLRREFMLFGIDVIVVAPGPVATPIWDKADAVDASAYAGTPYVGALTAIKKLMLDAGRKGLPPEALGRVVHEALTAARPRARYTATPEPLQNLLVRALPARLVDKMYAKRLGLMKKD